MTSITTEHVPGFPDKKVVRFDGHDDLKVESSILKKDGLFLSVGRYGVAHLDAEETAVVRDLLLAIAPLPVPVDEPAKGFTGPGRYRMPDGDGIYETQDTAADEDDEVYFVGYGYVGVDEIERVEDEPAPAAPAKSLDEIKVEDVADVEKVALFGIARQIIDPSGVDRVKAEDVALVAGLIAKA